MDDKALPRLWIEQDQCQECRDPRFAEPEAPTPARPCRPPLPRSILFVGEAPSRTGGFWKPTDEDAVRRLLLPMLPSWPAARDSNSREAIDWFVDTGYFFVQAMKWTLTPRAKRSYANLTTPEKCLAIDHAVKAHLRGEVDLIQPRAIIALGRAAWDACLRLAKLYGQARLDEPRFARARLRHHVLHPVPQDETPLHVTYLPGTRNERKRLIPIIHDDIGVFLRCIVNGVGCEADERKALKPTPRKPAFSRAELRELELRLKAAKLWPPPAGMTGEQLASELLRRMEEGEEN